MKQKLFYLIKYNKFVYSLYYYLMSFFINLLKLFVKPDNHLILFNSYAGRKYDDSPKAIYQFMKDDPRFEGFHFVWAFHQPEKFIVEGADVIKTDNLKYFKTALSARVWITNSSVERGLNFKGKNTFYLNTWHGSPIKKMGSDISNNISFRTKSNNLIDAMNTQSLYEANIFSRCFGIPRENFLEIGLPRNDELTSITQGKKEFLKGKINIPCGKKVILYCPTFREYEKAENQGIVLIPPVDFFKWEKFLSKDYVLLFRAHYEVSKIMNIKNNDFVLNVTDYPNINDLMIVSDILISDYSSIFFDYSIMNKPMLYFTYDYDLYESKRGMYFDVREYLLGGDNEDIIISLLKRMDDSFIDRTINFREKFVDFYGYATKKTVDYIADKLVL